MPQCRRLFNRDRYKIFQNGSNLTNRGVVSLTMTNIMFWHRVWRLIWKLWNEVFEVADYGLSDFTWKKKSLQFEVIDASSMQQDYAVFNYNSFLLGTDSTILDHWLWH